jgi:hypothetical protein
MKLPVSKVLCLSAALVGSAGLVRGQSPPVLSFLPEVLDQTPPRPGVPATETLRFETTNALQLLSNFQSRTPIEIEDWPIAVGERRRMLFERVRAAAPEFRFTQVGVEGKEKEIKTLEPVLLRGVDLDDPAAASAFISIDPTTSSRFMANRWGDEEWYLDPVAGTTDQFLLNRRTSKVKEAREGGRPSRTMSCDQGRGDLEWLPPILPRTPWFAGAESALGAERAQGAVAAEPFALEHEVALIFEVDNLFAGHFANNATAIRIYIEAMLAQLNQDAFLLNGGPRVRLTLSEVIMHAPSADGLTVGDSASTTAKLLAFRQHFSDNHGTRLRSAVVFLTGRRGGSTVELASTTRGNAWVGGLCASDRGYALVVPKYDESPQSSGEKVMWVLGHQLGHLFGARHSNCPTPTDAAPIDQCYFEQGDCFDGTVAESSCPLPAANWNTTSGSLMSLCSQEYGGMQGCASIRRFHPRSVTEWMDPFLQAQPSSCVAVGLTLDDVNPRSGPVAGGNLVRIFGSGFTASTQVQFGTQLATVQSVTSSVIEAVAPASAASQSVAVLVRDTLAGQVRERTRAGYYFYSDPTPPMNFVALTTPCRMVDTRGGGVIPSPPFVPGNGHREYTVAGACGVPAAAKAVSLVAFVIAPTGAGHLTMVPGNAGDLKVSTLNYSGGETIANNAIVRLSTDGLGTLDVTGACNCTLNLVIDVNGYFQ